jgi:Mg2+ and Co2+ transporter CorA
MHDIIEIECRPDRICIQDFILNFNDCTLITVTDFSVKDNIEDHITVRLIVFKSILFIISWEPLYSIERAFAEELKYVDCSLVNKPVDHLNYSNLHRKNTISLFSLESVMELDIMSSELNVYLFKIFEVIILRFEKVVIRLYEESKQHLLYAMEISHYERVDFILRLSLINKHLIMIKELVEPKMTLFKTIKKLFGTNSDLKYYMTSLQHHAEVLNNRINSSINFMRISEGLYQANVDNALTQNSVKLNLAMQHFSAIATCFLPLNLIAGLWGMNVVVPGMEEKTEYPFGIIIGIVLFLASCSFIYFKFRRWV